MGVYSSAEVFSVNPSVLQNAVGGLDSILGKAKDALVQLEAETFHYETEFGYEEPLGALGHFLDELGHTLSVVLEAAEMPEARRAMLKAWAVFKAGKDGLAKTVTEHGYGSLRSPAVTYAERLISALRMTVSREVSSEDIWVRRQLVRMLRDTAAIVRRDGRIPSNEIELQQVMHRYLRPAFSGFTAKIDISGSIKNFKPDCGVRPIGAAVEFKFVKSEAEVAQAFSGIAEDTAGYKGSKDWTDFYAVIYQADAFMLANDLEDDMRRIGAATWTPIIVNGKIRKTRQKIEKVSL